jgi:hypothetical protein
MFSIMIGAALILCTAASAATTGVTAVWTDGSDSGVVRGGGHSSVPVFLTQSVDPNTITGSMVACGGSGYTADNVWMRRFDLDGQHGIPGNFTVTSVDVSVGVSQSEPNAPKVNVTTYCYNANTPGLIDLTLLSPPGDTVQFVGPDTGIPGGAQTPYWTNHPMGGGCNGTTDDLVVGLVPDDCFVEFCRGWRPGRNSLGQIAPSYLGSVGCGFNNPVDTALIGFPTNHMLLNVNGDDGVAPTPVMGLTGIVVLVLTLLGGSAVLLRRLS